MQRYVQEFYDIKGLVGAELFRHHIYVLDHKFNALKQQEVVDKCAGVA